MIGSWQRETDLRRCPGGPGWACWHIHRGRGGMAGGGGRALGSHCPPFSALSCASEERQQCPERPLRCQHPPPPPLPPPGPAVWGLQRGCHSELRPPTRSRGESRGASTQPRLPPERQVTECGLHGPAPAPAATHRDSHGLLPAGGPVRGAPVAPPLLGASSEREVADSLRRQAGAGACVHCVPPAASCPAARRAGVL